MCKLQIEIAEVHYITLSTGLNYLSRRESALKCCVSIAKLPTAIVIT